MQSVIPNLYVSVMRRCMAWSFKQRQLDEAESSSQKLYLEGMRNITFAAKEEARLASREN